MKHFIVLLGFVFFSISAIAQQTYIGYGYDATGNRISRQLIIGLNIPKNETVNDSSYNDISYTDTSIVNKIGNQTITLYPNPTSGQITITGTQINSVEVYNTLGALLQKKEGGITSNTIDISQYPNGMYIVKIHLPEQTREWKIIKK